MGVEDRICGGLVGLALGEAAGLPVARLTPAEAGRRQAEPGPRVHGAGTTWALSVVDAFVDRRKGARLDEDLALKLQILVGAVRGAALRGGPQTVSGTLVQVAHALDEDDSRLAGVDEARGDGLLGPVPLVFALGDDEEDLARAVAAVVGLTHRHPEVTAAAGLWVGGVQLALRRPGARIDDALLAGRRFADRCLDALFEAKGGALSASRAQAEGALAVAVATARAGGGMDALCPPGLDARDAPARVAAAGLLSLRWAPGEALSLLESRAQGGGDADVLLPLLTAALGCRVGASQLPLGWIERLSTRKLVLTRARVLLGGPRPRSLVEDEIRVTRRWAAREPIDTDLVDDADREQLPLL